MCKWKWPALAWVLTGMLQRNWPARASNGTLMMNTRRRLVLFALAALLVRSPITQCAASLQANSGASAAQASAASTSELRFPVAHLHVGTWCMGYLYIGADELRFEVVRPDKDKAHSFQLKRSDIKAVQPWNLFGQVQNIAEIKTARSNYHFYLLQSDADLAPGSRWNVNNAAPATTLISAILNPAGFAPANPAANTAQTIQPVSAGPVAAAAPASAPPMNAAGVTIQPQQPQAAVVSQPRTTPVVNAPPASTFDPSSVAPSGALDGLYVGMTINLGRVGARYLLFTADGWVFRDFPEDGMEGFNAAAFRQDPSRNKSWTGRYRLDGNKIYILWQDYADHREILDRNENAASAGPDVYVPICRCDQKRLSGSYMWGLPASGQYLQFAPDGTFFDHATTDQLFVPSPFYDHPRLLRGTYMIQNQTLTLNFQDGRIKKKTFLAPKAQESQPTFDWIGLGIHRLYEQNYQPSP
jgi:hypothetical protein